MRDSNQITKEYFDSILLEMRHIDAVKPSSEVTFWGEKFNTPIATAALSHLNNICENGMAKMAEGARLAGALCFSGMGEEQEIKDMCATGAKVIKIVKPHADNATVLSKIKEAENAGVLAVGMDIDHAFDNSGDYDNVCDLDMRPKSLDELKSFINATNLPFIIKGILSVTDAKKALDAGAAGIIVSHHHGIMNYAIPPLMVLPEIVKVINKKIPIFVDCCIDNGMDAFKAIALGADGVCVGRAITEPLKNTGARGVCDKISQMSKELRGAMARTGFANIASIDDTVLWRR